MSKITRSAWALFILVVAGSDSVSGQAPAALNLSAGEFRVEPYGTGLMIYPPGQKSVSEIQVLVEDAIESGTCNPLTIAISANPGASAAMSFPSKATGGTKTSVELQIASGPVHPGSTTSALSLSFAFEDVRKLLARSAAGWISKILENEEFKKGLGCKLLDGADVLIVDAIREALPKTPQADLEARYGFFPDSDHQDSRCLPNPSDECPEEVRQVDVAPGTRICIERVESLVREKIPLLSAGAETCWEVGRRFGRSPHIVVDPFHGALGIRLESGPVTQAGSLRRIIPWISGTIELAALPWTHYRIFFPRKSNLYDQLFVGSYLPPKIPILVGANSVKVLDEVSREHRADELVEKCQLVDSRYDCFQFQELGFPKVFLPVLINGKPNWVALGTTLGDVLTQHRDLDVLQPEKKVSKAMERRISRLVKSGVSLQRRYRNRLHKVDFPNATLQSLDLPLVAGDQLKIKEID